MEGLTGAINGLLYVVGGIGAVIVVAFGLYLYAMRKGRMQGE